MKETTIEVTLMIIIIPLTNSIMTTEEPTMILVFAKEALLPPLFPHHIAMIEARKHMTIEH